MILSKKTEANAIDICRCETDFVSVFIALYKHNSNKYGYCYCYKTDSKTEKIEINDQSDFIEIIKNILKEQFNLT